MTVAAASSVDYADVQGLVRFGYKNMTEARYVLLRIANRTGARAWLRSAHVNDAVARDPAPTRALHVAFTADGLRALDVPKELIAAFSPEFLSGMAADENRSRRIGDVGPNAPSSWRWGVAERAPHLAVMFFAASGELETHVQRETSAWGDAFEIVERLDTSDLHGYEHFGFTDGISQPLPDWDERRDVSHEQDAYGNVVSLGEFLLGYPNEYGKYTERPLLDSNESTSELLTANDVPIKRDIGRNGTYVVIRDLEQDVRGFWRFALERSGGDRDRAEALASAFVGRTRSGEPLARNRTAGIAGIGARPDDERLNGFTFDDDPTGSRCPIGAHVRRANPRNADTPRPASNPVMRLIATLGLAPHRFGEDLSSSTRFHRVMRRGREYGPALPTPQAFETAPEGDAARGLIFICLNANIKRQFEFLQNAWLMGTKFNGLFNESDPLLGNRQPVAGMPATDAFTLPRVGDVAERIDGLPPFVTVRGGAYFFLPSLRVLRYFSDIGASNERNST